MGLVSQQILTHDSLPWKWYKIDSLFILKLNRKSYVDFTEARDSEWQYLGHMQVCTKVQTDNHASTPPLSFLQAGCPSCCPTNSIKALKARIQIYCSGRVIGNLCPIEWHQYQWLWIILEVTSAVWNLSNSFIGNITCINYSVCIHEWWGAGMVICLEQGADLHTAPLMPLPLTVSCSSKSRLVLPFWYRLTRVIPDKGLLNGCVCVSVYINQKASVAFSANCLLEVKDFAKLQAASTLWKW